jgi:hypothetical protein
MLAGAGKIAYVVTTALFVLPLLRASSAFCGPALHTIEEFFGSRVAGCCL